MGAAHRKQLLTKLAEGEPVEAAALDERLYLQKRWIGKEGRKWGGGGLWWPSLRQTPFQSETDDWENLWPKLPG